MISPDIFRKYDIRGIFNQDLSCEVTLQIGMAIGTMLRRKGITKIAVGCDGRLSSPALSQSLIQSITKCGIDVIDIGLVPTPCLYFSVHHLKLAAGIMVTGSHNPKDYNGFKIMLANESYYGEKIQDLYKLCISKEFVSTSKSGIVETKDITSEYIDEITRFLSQKAINVCFDAGNGAGGEIVSRIASKIGIPKENLLFTEIDGNFPNHHPDPTIESNMRDLSNLVLKNSAACGFGLDGDADRIGIIDDKGRFVYGDVLMCFLSEFLLKHNPGATIISDVKASDVLFSYIEKHGGKPIMWQTGHSIIKDKMKESGALLAGEMSGHVFYKDRYYGYDDGIYTAMRIMEILQKYNIKLSDFIDTIPKTFSTAEIKVEVPESEKFAIVDHIIQHCKSEYRDVCNIDGVRVKLEHGWFLIRASNTQNCLVIRCEASSQEKLSEICRITQDILSTAGLESEIK